MPSITRTQAEALAAAANRIRPDWDYPGVLAAIGKAKSLATPADLAVALFRLAGNAQMRTPALLPDTGPHWAATTVANRQPPTHCGEHPQHLARSCQPCADEVGSIDHAAGVAHVKAVLADRNKSRHHQGKL